MRERKQDLTSSQRRSPVTCCTKLCNFFSTFWLQIFNFLDLAIGTILIVISIYIKINISGRFNDPYEYRTMLIVAWVSLALGLLFISVSSFSFCGIISVHCRSAVLPSGYLALLLAVSSLCGGIISLVCENAILEFIDDNQKRLTMKSEHVRQIHIFYDFVTIALFVSFAVEMIRFMLSSQYVTTANLIDSSGDIEAESLLRASGRYQSEETRRSSGRYDPYQKRMNNSGYGGAQHDNRGRRGDYDRERGGYGRDPEYRDRAPL